MSEQSAIRVRHDLHPPRLPLSEEQELVIYRVAQEALNNVIRHAQATEAELRLERAGPHVVLTVRDNGRGIPRAALRSAQGIAGMRERALLIGAEIAITPLRGHGTEVRLSIPVEEGA